MTGWTLAPQWQCMFFFNCHRIFDQWRWFSSGALWPQAIGTQWVTRILLPFKHNLLQQVRLLRRDNIVGSVDIYLRNAHNDHREEIMRTWYTWAILWEMLHLDDSINIGKMHICTNHNVPSVEGSGVLSQDMHCKKDLQCLQKRYFALRTKRNPIKFSGTSIWALPK